MMNTPEPWAVARRELLRAIHEDDMSDHRRGEMRQHVLERDLAVFGEVHVGEVMAMLKDQRGWSVDYVLFMWYMMNMAYYSKRLDQRLCKNVIKVCLALERAFGTYADDYFVHGNPRYPAGNLMSLRHDVMRVIENNDREAYNWLVQGIGEYDEMGRVLGRYQG